MYENENDTHVKLKYFGLPKLAPFLYPYRFIILSMIVMGLIGSLMDIFFTGNAKIAVFVLYLAALMFMMSKEARIWYNVK